MSENQKTYKEYPIPFSSYDFFGYLAPGIAFITLIFSFEFYMRCNVNGYSSFLLSFIKYVIKYQSYLIQKLGLIYQIAILIFAILLIYILGHFISTLSSFFIDRILIFKSYGYPFNNLILQSDISEVRDIKKDHDYASANFYKATFFWINIFVVSFFINNCCIQIKIFILFKYIYYMSKFLLIILIFIKLYPYLLRIFSKKWPEFIFPTTRVIIYWLSTPFNYISNFLSNYINTKRGFDDEFIKKTIQFIRINFKIKQKNINKYNTNVFWLPYMYVAKNSIIFYQLMKEWLHLYSFMRNLSTAVYFGFIYIVIQSYVNREILNYSEYTTLIYIILITFSLSILFLVRYYYLFYCYFTKFTFRAFYLLNIEEEKTE